MWLAGGFVSRRVAEHVAQEGSAEVAANAAAVLRQSGLASAASGDALVIRGDVADALVAWNYFDTVVSRNPNTVGVRVYDEALSDSDVAERMGGEPTLVADWRFDTGSGQVATDSTG